MQSKLNKIQEYLNENLFDWNPKTNIMQITSNELNLDFYQIDKNKIIKLMEENPLTEGFYKLNESGEEFATVLAYCHKILTLYKLKNPIIN